MHQFQCCKAGPGVYAKEGFLWLEGDVVQPVFRRSSRCEGGCCVEVAVGPHSGRVLIRNSDRTGMLEFGRHDWAMFIMKIKCKIYSPNSSARSEH